MTYIYIVLRAVDCGFRILDFEYLAWIVLIGNLSSSFEQGPLWLLIILLTFSDYGKSIFFSVKAVRKDTDWL